DIGEARIALEDALADAASGAQSAATTSSGVAAPAAPAARRPSPLPWAIAAAALALAVAALLWGRGDAAPAPAETLRFAIEMPNEGSQRQGDGMKIALSPDGRTIVTCGGIGDEHGLYLRTLGSFEARRIEGTAGGNRPFFSPDGAWIAYVVGSELRKIPLAGGPPTRLGRLPASPFGLVWGADDFIYYGQRGHLYRIPSAGGAAEVVESEGDHRLAFPWPLPGGETLLASAPLVSTKAANMVALDLATGAVKDLGVVGSNPHYLPSGHVLFAAQGSVFVAPFDLERLAFTGPRVPVLPHAWVDQDELQLAVSDGGTVAYLPGVGAERQRLVSVSQDGAVEPLLREAIPFQRINDPRFSHDGRQLILGADNSQIWLIDLDTQTPTLMSESGFYAYWGPSDREIAYSSARSESFDIYRRPVDLSRPEQLLLDVEDNLRLGDWTRQGAMVIRQEIEGKGMDLKLLPDPDDLSTMRPLLEGTDDELAPNVSADGRWLAYVSDYSGADEVYVTSFPEPGGRSQVSIRGGNSPLWAPDGRTLYYFEG
ncbi:MAG TPA: hypothetical protein VLA66_12250, partial [Thermoanaerobaculia bacterium]|nr:hypothetical protein [Thermoanaerobaculia bacterium]